uniref:Galactosylceramide sulfotransferase-like n=1 Tax=Saccoglossus kowalevskii TaxID=10224 RepID=A0ABM0GTK7_SACKO|nr:PREDICTED: galactosylceramide sulfotransferase-like [Saccoglossus kowalevskii]
MVVRRYMLVVPLFSLLALTAIYYRWETSMVYVQRMLNQDNTAKEYSRCEPKVNFIFVKTAKTGGSTVASILYRYGFQHNLTAALPDPPSDVFLRIRDSEVLATNYNCTKPFPGYNYISNHIGNYNYSVLNNFIPNAKFITIVRSPYRQFESYFYYFKLHVRHGLQNSSNPFETFLTDESYKNKAKRAVRYRQLHWLGYHVENNGNYTNFKSTLKELDKQFALVMITEYMDESLVLLKKMMCWTIDDVMYYSQKVAARKKLNITKDMENVLAAGMVEDIRMYNYFNRTLWDKIDKYDGNFTEDLRLYRAAKSAVCRDKEDTEFCTNIRRGPAMYKKQIAKIQFNRFCQN